MAVKFKQNKSLLFSIDSNTLFCFNVQFNWIEKLYFKYERMKEL